MLAAQQFCDCAFSLGESGTDSFETGKLFGFSFLRGLNLRLEQHLRLVVFVGINLQLFANLSKLRESDCASFGSVAGFHLSPVMRLFLRLQRHLVVFDQFCVFLFGAPEFFNPGLQRLKFFGLLLERELGLVL